jgi:hypothetical protein
MLGMKLFNLSPKQQRFNKHQLTQHIAEITLGKPRFLEPMLVPVAKPGSLVSLGVSNICHV